MAGAASLPLLQSRSKAKHLKAMSDQKFGAIECRKQASDCLLLRNAAGISAQRATLLLTMARTWTALANLHERLSEAPKSTPTK
jgi:hypothetical protein